ncbi:hypothetical protein NE865_13678 [Phthorimaea operculella]|nr:hypothetical protein NE865_13678 [Phthorimaea operculella]
MTFWYQIYCGFSTAVVIDQLHWMLYNLMFTAFPPLIIGVYDRVAPAALLMERSGLYSHCRRGLTYQTHSYWTTLAEAVYISVVIFFVNTSAFWDTDGDLYVFGLCNVTCCLVIMYAYVAVEFKSWTAIHVLGLLGSLLSFYTVTIIYQTQRLPWFALPASFHVILHAAKQPAYWLLVLLTTTTALIPRLLLHALRNSLCPSALWRATMARRRKPRRLPYAAHYHTTTASAHVYRPTDEDGLSKPTAEVTTIT